MIQITNIQRLKKYTVEVGDFTFKVKCNIDTQVVSWKCLGLGGKIMAYQDNIICTEGKLLQGFEELVKELSEIIEAIN